MKRVFSFILALCLALSVCICAQAKILGDVNSSGKVDSTDALTVLQFAVNKIKTIDKDTADVNLDAKINSTDALMILKISVGLAETSEYKVVVKLGAKVGSESYNSKDVIPVRAGDTVYVTLSMANNFYTGTMNAQLYYNNSIFSSAPGAKFNTNGRLYAACGKQTCTFTDWDNIAPLNKERYWPDFNEAQLKEFKKNHKFLRVTMTPNPNITSELPKAINEELVVIEFKVSSTAKKGTTGQISIPFESRRTRTFEGYLMCSVNPSEDISEKGSPYVEGLSYDCTNAVLNFKVV